MKRNQNETAEDSPHTTISDAVNQIFEGLTITPALRGSIDRRTRELLDAEHRKYQHSIEFFQIDSRRELDQLRRHVRILESAMRKAKQGAAEELIRAIQDAQSLTQAERADLALAV